MRRRLPPLVDVPFVISDSIFINPKYRGTRLLGKDAFDPDGSRTALYRKQIRIHDARSLMQAPSIRREGFQLIEAPIDLDFSDLSLVTTRFYKHCADLVKAATGCLATRTMQHEFRAGKVIGPAGMGRYALVAHADFTPFVEDITDVPEKHHFALFNVWRGTDPAQEIELMPLALCDITTVASDDIIYADCLRRTEPRTRLIDCRLIHDSSQGWYYFPRMTPDEVLIFKQYDTREEDAGRRAVFHAAFWDSTTRKDAPLRESIEVRVLAIFPEADLDRERRKARFQAKVPNIRLDGTVSSWRHEEMVDWNGAQRQYPRAGDHI